MQLLIIYYGRLGKLLQIIITIALIRTEVSLENN